MPEHFDSKLVWGEPVVEVILFLGIICLGFFIPVRFRIYYRKTGPEDLLIFEMSFLHGLLKRRKVTSLLKPTSPNHPKREKTFGRWFFFHRKQTKLVTSVSYSNSNSWQKFLERYQNYGLGVTLLTYFLPGKYQRWLLVVQDLEQRGQVDRLIWKTQIGTGDAAQTAILYGLLSGLKPILLSYLQCKIKFSQKPELEVIPDYQQTRGDTLIDCIFRVKLGYIIIASLMARFRFEIRRGLSKGGVLA